jgi:DNA repair photolyase
MALITNKKERTMKNTQPKSKVATKAGNAVKFKAIRPSGTRFGYCINCYDGCGHGCIYCYGMKARYMKYRDWIKPRPRYQVVDWLRNDIELIKQHPEIKTEIKDFMICSITDCYQPLELEHRLTREVIKILIQNDLPFTVLTKNVNVLEDIALFRNYDKCRAGLTIVTLDDTLRQKLEPNSSPIDERINAIKELKQAGINTYCSVEPILPDKRSDPIAIAELLKDYVDLFEFGKWNPKKHRAEIENTLGTRYNREYYVEVFKDIAEYCADNDVTYCHAGHSKDYLMKRGMEFIPYPTVLQ